MLVNFSNVSNIFIVCGHTDMHCGIDGLAGIITDKYNLALFNDALFLFCGRKKDRFKVLYWDKDRISDLNHYKMVIKPVFYICF